MAETREKFDPYAILQALDRHRVSYVLIGAFARVLQGTEEITRGIDIVPSTRGDNLKRLEESLREMNATRTDKQPLDLTRGATIEDPVIELATDYGEMKVVPDALRNPRLRRPSARGEPRAARPRRAPCRSVDRRSGTNGFLVRPRAISAAGDAASAANGPRARSKPIHRSLRRGRALQVPTDPTGRSHIAGERPDVRAVAARRALDDHPVAEPQGNVAVGSVIDPEEDQVARLVSAGRGSGPMPRVTAAVSCGV